MVFGKCVLLWDVATMVVPVEILENLEKISVGARVLLMYWFLLVILAPQWEQLHFLLVRKA